MALNHGKPVLLVGQLVTDETTLKPAKIDISGDIVVINHEHSKVHQGEYYSNGYYNSAVANNASIELLLQTGAKEVHIVIKVGAGGDAIFYAFEGTTFSAAGTAHTPVNHKRSSTNTALTTITDTPTLLTDGTQIFEEYTPGGTGGQSVGIAEALATEQAVLKANEDYLFRLTNISGVTQPLQIQVGFYEV